MSGSKSNEARVGRHGAVPHDTTDELGRFSQHFTAFARARWDPTCAAYGRESESIEAIAALEKPGYGLEDFALRVGSWALADAYGGSGREDSTARDIETAERGRGDRFVPEDWATFTRRLKRSACFYGAALAGVTRVNPLWVYACDGDENSIELPEGVDTAIVMAVEMDYDLIRASPSALSNAAVGNGYSRMAFVAACVARFLSELGWRAIPCGNDTALSIPLAIDAGLGELARNGLLITIPHGPRVRLCKVFTDAPLVPDEPITFGVREFCDVCLKCADTCPSDSISHAAMTTAGPTPSNNPGVRKWYINPETCLAFWRANGTGCANCIRSCPFNKPTGWLHDAARRLIKMRSSLIDRILVRLDDLCRYGRQADISAVFPPSSRAT